MRKGIIYKSYYSYMLTLISEIHIKIQDIYSTHVFSIHNSIHLLITPNINNLLSDIVIETYNSSN